MIERNIAKILKEQEQMEIIKTITDAMQKQIPKEPKWNGEPYCPICDGILWDYQKYCDECGQKLRWKND